MHQNKGTGSDNKVKEQFFHPGTRGVAWQTDFIDTLHQNNWVVHSEDEMARFSLILSTTAKAQRDTWTRLRICESLRFSGMKERLERIPKAYRETFDWVYRERDEPLLRNLFNCKEANSAAHDLSDRSSNPSRITQGGVKKRPWSNFVQWLSGEERLYWITGKPGSGKSTLMKYLFDDPRTSQHLRLWSQACPVVMAGFFFWNSGTAMQMSQMGMLRTLLYQAIVHDPDRITALFPVRWRYYELFGEDIRPWSWSELLAASRILTGSAADKFVFFIDGLDEFDGNNTELAGFILELASKENVKVCVSSRPWLAFEDAFQFRPSLRLEDLTAPDIRLFVEGSLAENRMFSQLQRLYPEDAESLIIEVTGKACGVCLWVRLVVVSLLEGLRDGDGVGDLRERLLAIPTDLEAMFWRILHCLDHVYLEQASCLFQLIHAAREPLSLLTLSFAEDDIKTCMTTKVKPMSTDGQLFQAESMRRRLNSRCKGLLDVPTFEYEGAEARVQYLHRTVRDFLAKDDVWEYIISSTSDPYDPEFKLCGAFLLRIKTFQPRRSEIVLDNFWTLFKSCMYYSSQLEHRKQDIHIDVIDELAEAADELFNTQYPSGETLLKVVLEECRKNGLFVMQRITHWIMTGDSGVTSFLDYALAYPLYSYVEYKLQNGHTLDPSTSNALLKKGHGKDPEGMARIRRLLRDLNKVSPAPKVSRSRSRFQVHNLFKRLNRRGS